MYIRIEKCVYSKNSLLEKFKNCLETWISIIEN